MSAEWIVPDWPAPERVRALITTRSGGVSAGRYAGLNLASHVADDPACVEANRERLRSRLPSPPLWLEQVHGTRVVLAEDSAVGVRADAAISRRAGVVCAVLTADCLPVLLCDERARVVGIAHAGWRGLAGGVIEETVRAMQAPAGSLLAYLGPAIGPASYEVGDEVRRAFTDASVSARAAFRPGAPDKWMADLYELARQRLAALGVRGVFGGGFDTAAEPARFYSYRRDGTTGRMASMIWLE